MNKYHKKNIKKGDPEIYLLKIYHRNRTPEETVVGTVENVMVKKKQSFRTEGELLDCIEEMKNRESEEA